MDILWTREITYVKEVKRADVNRLAALIKEHHDATMSYDQVGQLAAENGLVGLYPDAVYAFIEEIEERNRGEEHDRGAAGDAFFAV